MVKTLKEQFYDSIRSLPDYVKQINDTGKDLSWFNRRINDKLIEVEEVTAPEVGKIYWFYYELDNWKKYPFWDSMPLVIVTDVTSTTFTGINIHYLPNQFRIPLFLTLLEQKSNSKTLDKQSKILVRPHELSALPNFKMLTHQYKKANIGSGPYEVCGTSWGSAVALPLADFKISNSKATKNIINWNQVILQPNISIILNQVKKK